MEWFKKISAIPRPSGYEEQITEFLVDIAKARQYHWRIDHVGNVCIDVPGKGRGAGKPTLVLQSHMDMVCEKLPDVEHNFMTDPIQLREENGYLSAAGTTLGADNGVGIALALSAADQPNCPPLELLFTVDEEVSMLGAKNMQPNFFHGKYLINLDSEDDQVFTIGCAGSLLVTFTLPVAFDSEYQAQVKAEFVVDKLLGGHSGTDIHKGRSAATKVCAQQLLAFTEAGINFRIISVDAGNATNAIARLGKIQLAFATVEDFQKAQDLLLDLSSVNEEEKPSLTLKKIDTQAQPFDIVSHNRFIAFIYELPHGPLVYYDQAAGLVETSCNFASIKKDEGNNYIIKLFYRSFVERKFVKISEELNRIADRHSVKIEISDPDPAWPPQKDNDLLNIATSCYQKLFNRQVSVAPIHAGLECGYLEKLSPNLSCISIGPNILDAHSPDERLEIASLSRTEQLLFNIINDFIQSF